MVQTRKDGSTVIYAGAQEAETVGGGTLVRTYWPLGLGMDIDKPGAATELNWVHKDRLGSAVAITDQSGNLKERLEYDTWGKRRTLEGASTPDTLDGQVDNKGCTGHEMLDLLDLIHMNGRVYDPLAARFLSPDPFINDAANGQSYNRYTYVLNNPTNLVDPSGYEECESSSYCSITRSLSNSANMLGVIAVNAQRAATTGVQKVANQSPRIAKVFGQGFVFGAVRALPLAGGTVIAGGGPLNPVTDGVAVVEVVGAGLLNGTRFALAETTAILNEDQGRSAEEALSGEKADTNSEGAKDGKKDTLQPGPHAGESIPARGPGRDFSKDERDKINEIGQNTGCHTCGSKDPGTTSGNHIPDHQPPNALNASGGAQELYPHCLTCSRVQGGQVRGTQSR